MPGKCKFQDSWLLKGIYKDWLVKDLQDIHFARCRACGKSIKLQTMGEAALTSHAGGAGHKAAVRKLLEGSFMMINSAGQINGTVSRTDENKDQVAICLQRDVLDRITGSDCSDLHHSPTSNSPSHNAELQDVTFPAALFTAPGNLMMINSAGQVNGSVSRTADRKDQVAICLQRDALDRLTGSDCSDLHHSPTSNSPSHNAELQDVTYPAAFFTSPAAGCNALGDTRILSLTSGNSDLAGTSRIIRQRLHPSGSDGEEVGRHSTQHDSIDLTRLEHQQRTEALEQQQQMKILEWENRIKVLAWEQELVREKKRAARQKQKAFRMKKAYYKAKLKRMGEEMPPSSSSSSDEEEKTSDLTE